MSFLLAFRSDAGKKMRIELPWASLFVGAAALSAAPILIYFALHPDHLLLRSSQLWLFDQSVVQAMLRWANSWKMCGYIYCLLVFAAT